MAITAYLGLIMTLSLPRVAIVLQDPSVEWQGPQPAQNDFVCAKPYDAEIKTYEDLIKQKPRDGSLYYRLGICLYWQVRSANEMAIDANKTLIEFITDCNRNISCDDDVNKKKIRELRSRQDAFTKNFDALRDRAIEAYAAVVALGGPDVPVARKELEKLYKTKSKVDSPDPLDGLDDLIARRKAKLSK